MTATIAALPRRAIRAMTEDELPAAAKLLHRCWHDAYRRHLPPRLLTGRTEDYWVDYLDKRLSRTWLAWIGDRPAGLTSVTANCVDDLWVARRYRRRGLGRDLLDTALGHLEARGFEHAQAGCEDFNADALAFFRRLEWAEIGSEPLLGLVPGRQVNALVFSRPVESLVGREPAATD
jgi:GNAT superfamily N-acetyltransferase